MRKLHMILLSVTLMVFSVNFLGFTASLDRYPEYYADEPFFSYPAIRYLEGQTFTYQVGAKMPHADKVFAMHGPLFPWLQVLTFRLLGISQFTCRIPEYLGAHIAVLVLVGFLAHRGAWLAACTLPLVWVGDRSSQEVLLGRMEGLALFALVLGLVSLVRAVEAKSRGWSAASGGVLGLAAGLHPICVNFGLVAVLVLWFLTPTGSRVRLIVAFLTGGLIPIFLAAWCWSPNLAEALEQFRWSTQFQSEDRARRGISWLLTSLHWSRYWWLGLVSTTILFLTPLTIYQRTLVRSSPGMPDGRSPLWLASIGFSIAGLSCVLISAKHSYYLVYYSVWPVLSLLLLVESPSWNRGTRRAALAIAALLFVCWVPSLLWNSLRFREMMIYHGKMDPAIFAHRLAQIIPSAAQVTGSPELFLIARKAGLNYTPLPWFHERTPVPTDRWVVLTGQDRANNDMVAPADLAERPVLDDGVAFPEVMYLKYPFVVYGPAVPRRDGTGSSGKL